MTETAESLKDKLPEGIEIPAHIPPELVYLGGRQDDPEFAKNPFPFFERVRKEAPPIYFTPNLSPNPMMGAGSWTIGKASLAREALQMPEVFTTTIDYPGGLMVRPRRMIPLELDPPEHQKYRALLAPLFSPKSIDAMEHNVVGTCTDLMDNILPKGECMFMGEFARPYPATIFMKLMGLPMDMQDTFIEWEAEALNSGDFEGMMKGTHKIADYLRGLIEERRAKPADDLITLLTKSEIDGKPLDNDTVHDFCMLLFIAGLDTVTAGTMHVFYYLAAHPDRKQELIDDPDLIPNAVEELLRYHSWIGSPRAVAKDIDFHGVKMKAGDRMSVSHVLCGHDPDEFPNPETIDFHREPNPHLAFAAGVHRCAGSHLARREIRVSVREWLKRAPDFHIKEGYEVQYQTRGMFYPEDLHLEWTVK